jgi:4-amino-4-deoxy-L-arabinose transferase-like glycosyltransferase
MRQRADLASILLIALSVVRIASTFTLYSATVDEPMHVSAALQLYRQHDYSYQPENPPLPRLVFGLAPWLGGMEFDASRTQVEQLSRVFYSTGRYETNLVLARCGNLLFFVIAATAVWWWARRELGASGGFIAVLLFAAQPIVSGYAGLATHDIAATAGVAVALVAYARWMDVASMRRAMVFGLAYGFASICKFSCIGYVPAACLAMYVVRVIRDPELRAAWKRIPASFAAALVTCLIVIWAGYGFSVTRLSSLDPIGDVLGDGALARFVAHHPEWPLPARWFFIGIGGMIRIEDQTFFSYAFGEISPVGWWWYFPVAVALKSTHGSLLLGLAALFARRTRVAGEGIAAALAILAVSLSSHLDLGVRYVLPLYAPLSVAGAAAAIAMVHHRVARVFAIALLAWHVVATSLAIPDAFPYFNEVGGRRPWLKLLDSNLDWGQDVLRLREAVRRRNIDRIGVALTGWIDYDALGFPQNHALKPRAPAKGWVAVSEQEYHFKSFPSLYDRPYWRIGKSIRLYSIP